MYKKIGLVLSFLVLSISVHAQQGVRAILGEDSARFIYVTEAWGQEIGSLDVEAGVLVNGSDNTLLHLGALVQHQNIDRSINLSVGARVYYTNIENKDATLIALGGDLLLSPENWSGMGIGVSYYTAPSVTTFSDAEGFTEYSVSVHYQITPQANLYFGYQKVTIELRGNIGERDLEEGSFLGIKLDF